MQSNEGKTRCNSLWRLVGQFSSKFKIQNSKLQSAIIPVLIHDEKKAVETAAKLREQNIFIPAIRFPTVSRGAARLRVTLTAAHSSGNVAELARALKDNHKS